MAYTCSSSQVDGSYAGEHRDAFAPSRSTPRHSNAVSIVHFSLAKNLTGDVLTFEVRERQRTGGCISSLIAQQEDQARTVSPKLCKSQ